MQGLGGWVYGARRGQLRQTRPGVSPHRHVVDADAADAFARCSGGHRAVNTDITADSVCTPSPDVVARDIEGDLVIVPVVAGVGDADDELYTLNETAREVWDRLDGRLTLADVAAALAEEFEVDEEELQRDVVGFARELARRGIVVVRD